MKNGVDWETRENETSQCISLCTGWGLLVLVLKR